MPSLQVTVLVFDSFSNMVLACLLEPLRVVRDTTMADIAWTIVTHKDRPVVSASGLRIAPDMERSNAPRPDVVLIIGGDRFREDADDAALRRSFVTIRHASTVIAADTGAWLLAKGGFLNGRKATLHWQLLDEFSETFPGVEVTNERYTRDGHFWTCGSASSALDLILVFIRDRYGQAIAFDAGAMFLHDTSQTSSRDVAENIWQAKVQNACVVF